MTPTSGLRAELSKALPNVPRSDSPPDRIAYARDLWPRHHLAVRSGRIAEHAPGLIVWPGSTEEVAEVVAWCAGAGVPLVPYGAGSGVCGGILPDERTVVLDLKRMKRWRRLEEGGSTLDVEAGALGITLEEDLASRGFTLGHFPSSILCSTVGGWVAARSAGQCSGRYGKIEDMVASLECVVGRGEIVRFERRVSGPDLTPLIIGSEGVLGVVTSARLRLHPAPPARTLRAFSFPTVEAGWSAMQAMFQDGLRPAVSRLYDPFDSMVARMGARRRARRSTPEAPSKAARSSQVSERSSRSSQVSERSSRSSQVSERTSRSSEVSERSSRSSRSRFPGAGGLALRSLLRAPGTVNRIVDAIGAHVSRGSTLVLVFEESAAEGAADLARASDIARRHGARDLGEAPAKHWIEHRYSVSYRQAPVFMAGAFSDTMEVAASWSRLEGLYHAVRAALGRHVFVMAHLSHAYPDGCSIYFTFAGAAPTPEAGEATYDAAWRAALDAAIGAGGTLSHHHGVGRSKAPRLGSELGLGVDIVHALRGVFDEAGIMNPGNLLPRDAPARALAPTPPALPVLDKSSLLVHASGNATLASVERTAAAAGLTLRLGEGAPPSDTTTVDSWIAGGAPGAPDPWLDPVDHTVAGFTARLVSGADLDVRPAPRRAVGPDLFALFLGMKGRVGAVTSAHLRVHGPRGARPLSTSIERDPPVSRAEADWIDRVAKAAAAVR